MRHHHTVTLVVTLSMETHQILFSTHDATQGHHTGHLVEHKTLSAGLSTQGITIIIMALQPLAGPWSLFQSLDPIHSR
jgi:hypothetical protein